MKVTTFVQKANRRIRWLSSRRKKYLLQVSQNSSSQVMPGPLFVFGAQRSGTNMLMDTLDKSVDTWVYNESNLEAFYDNYRIKDHEVRKRLIERARCQWVVFKPLCDSQYADHLLDSYPGSKGVWIYRSYRDVANSARRKWGSGQKWLVTQLATKDHYPHWFCERVPEHVLKTVKSLYHDDLSEAEASAIKWYVRNMFFFELGLDRRSNQVMFIKYEDLVTNPQRMYSDVFDFLDIEYDPAFADDTFASSVGKEVFPDIAPDIEAVCEEMLARLDAHLMDLQPSAV